MPYMEALGRSAEPVAFLSGLASSLVDPTILMLVYERSGATPGSRHDGTTHAACGGNATTQAAGSEDDAQKRASQFFMFYNIASSVSSMVPSLVMGQLGDLLSRRLLLVVPLLGTLLSQLLLLFVVGVSMPLRWLYGYVLVSGLAGGSSTLWAGANAYAAQAVRTPPPSSRVGRSDGDTRGGDGDVDDGEASEGAPLFSDRPRGHAAAAGYGSAAAAIHDGGGGPGGGRRDVGEASPSNQGTARQGRGIQTPVQHGRSSRRLMLLELSFGLAATLGSVITGHIFVNFRLPLSFKHGSFSVLAAMFMYTLAIFYSLFVLKDFRPQTKASRVTLKGVLHVYRFGMFKPGGPSDQRAVFALLFTSAMLYQLVVRAFIDFLGLFMLRSPLCFGPDLVGYATAIGCCIYISSFLANLMLSRCWTDQALAMMGIASFCAGTLVMTFVKTMPMFFLARVLMQLSLMPLPNIRSSMAKITDPQWLGTVFTLLACAMSLVRVVGSITFNYIYKDSLELPFCLPFLISGIVGVTILLPLGVVWWKKGQWRRTEPSSPRRRP
ncbi:solute carrier family 46 member 2-like [Petromyzon marinus]|uniref:solute carrier family 46 member 2-like n=1 Tax=Petromyzon marinus TaxID=7757 RepID=UPI003F6E8523